MKRLAWIGIVCLAATASAAPLRDPKEDVKAAAKKLGDAGNYSWTATVKNNADTGAAPPRFAMGPVEGKTDKDGMVWVSAKMGENGIESVMKGEKFAVKTADGWKGSAELQPGAGQQGQPNPAMFAGRFLRNVKAPVAGVSEAVDRLKDLKSEGDGVYSGEFTDEGAKETISPPRPAGAPPGGQNFQPPQVSDAKGSIKIWVKDGMLFKIETTVTGKMTIRDQERSINRTTTVEIKDVGTTKIELPEEAKKKLE